MILSSRHTYTCYHTNSLYENQIFGTLRYSLQSEGQGPELCEVNKYAVPRELSRANSSKKYIYILIYLKM